MSTAAWAPSTVPLGAVFPSILDPPQDEFVLEGDTAVLAVTANGTGPLTYQWKREGTILNGFTESVLTLPNSMAAQSGHYTVVIGNILGKLESDPALLTIGPGAAFAGVPGNAAAVLQIQRSAATVVLSWPTLGTDGFELERTTSLLPSGWKRVEEAPRTAGDHYEVVRPLAPGLELYRLRFRQP